MNVNPGELNKKVDIIKKTVTYDSDGFSVNSESIVHSCWAKVWNMSGTEAMKSNADFSEMKTRFLIRSTKKTIDTDMEISFSGKRYDIKYINDYNYSGEYLEILGELRELV